MTIKFIHSVEKNNLHIEGYATEVKCRAICTTEGDLTVVRLDAIAFNPAVNLINIKSNDRLINKLIAIATELYEKRVLTNKN